MGYYYSTINGKLRSAKSLIEDAPPMGSFSNVLWFSEKDIPELLAIENEKHLRIFPRYIYRTELVTKIDNLLAYHYINGKEFEQAITDHKADMTDAREKLKAYARENNINFENLVESSGLVDPDVFINQVQETLERMKIDPLIPAQFLKVLTSGANPLGNFTADTCNYLWAEINPFENRPFPEFFADEIDDPDLGLQIHEKNKEYIKMAKLVQENSTKQYTQEFLRENLVDFLEEYENLIQRNEFSYAHVWQLKARYLEDLYKKVINGLSEEAPYVMKRDGEDWQIVYNGESKGLLKGIGFAYIYHLLANESEEYYHSELLPAGGNQASIPESKNSVEHDDAPGQSRGEPMISKEGLNKYFNAIKRCQEDIDKFRKKGDQEERNSLINEKDRLYKELLRVYDPKTNKIRYSQNIDKKKVVDSVGNAIKRALKSLAQKHPEAHQHLFKALDGEHLYRDTLSYRPAPEDKLDWILA